MAADFQAQQGFEDALKRKYDILQQGANADATRANATMQGVNQQPAMQAAADAASAERARLASETQLQAEQVRGGFGLQERDLTNQGQLAATNAAGNWGLQESQTRANAQMQPEFGIHTDELTGQSSLYGKNLSGLNYLGSSLQKPTTMRMRPSYTSLGTQGLGLGLPGYRSGGAVRSGEPIQVGEEGQELYLPANGAPAMVGRGGPEAIVPHSDGMIIPNEQSGGFGLQEGKVAGSRDREAGFGLTESSSAERQMAAATGRLKPSPSDPDYADLYQRTLFNQGADAVRDWAPPNPRDIAPVLTNRPNDREVLVANALRRGERPDFTAGETRPPQREGQAISMDGRLIDPGREQGADSPASGSVPRAAFDPTAFHANLTGMRNKQEQAAAYAALSPEDKSVWRKWKTSQDAGESAGEQGAPNPPSRPAVPAASSELFTRKPEKPTAAEEASAAVDWAVNRPVDPTPDPGITRALGLSEMLLGGPRQIGYGLSERLARPVSRVAGEVVDNFRRALRGQPTYAK
uniref:Uncharacterized protein n=1 Tax=Desulfovibrio sp. U5L TaxID=596152 RepID=I2Q1D0_9BACT